MIFYVENLQKEQGKGYSEIVTLLFLMALCHYLNKKAFIVKLLTAHIHSVCQANIGKQVQLNSKLLVVIYKLAFYSIKYSPY